MCIPISGATKTPDLNCFQKSKKLTELTFLATAVISVIGALLALLGLTGYLPSYTLYVGLTTFALGVLAIFLIQLAAKSPTNKKNTHPPSIIEGGNNPQVHVPEKPVRSLTKKDPSLAEISDAIECHDLKKIKRLASSTTCKHACLTFKDPKSNPLLRAMELASAKSKAKVSHSYKIVSTLLGALGPKSLSIEESRLKMWASKWANISPSFAYEANSPSPLNSYGALLKLFFPVLTQEGKKQLLAKCFKAACKQSQPNLNGHLYSFALELLDDPSDWNEYDDQESPLLHALYDRGHLDLVKHLVERGANSNRLSPKGLAIPDKDFEFLQSLQDHGFNVDQQAVHSGKGFTPLFEELERGLDASECEMYLPRWKDLGLDFYSYRDNSDQTNLHLLVQHPKIDAEVLEAILRVFPVPKNLSLLDVNGETPLHLAVKQNPSLISVLIKGGVNWKESADADQIPPLLAWDIRESKPDLFSKFYEPLKKDPTFVPYLYTHAINQDPFGKEMFVALTKSWPIFTLDSSQAEKLLLLAFQKLTLNQCASLLFSMPYGTDLRYTEKLKEAAEKKALDLAPILEVREDQTYLLTPYDFIARDDLQREIWQAGLEFYWTHSGDYLYQHKGVFNPRKDPDIQHLPPMHFAAYLCRRDRIDWLHAKSPGYLFYLPRNTLSPIHTIGDHEGAIDILFDLVKKGAADDQKDERGFDVYSCYAASGNLPLLRKLIERYGSSTHQDWLLYHAATYGRIEVINHLVNTHNANPRAQLGTEQYQDTAFHAAARNNQRKALKALMQVPSKRRGNEVDSSCRFFLDDFPTKKDFDTFIKKEGKVYKGFLYRQRYLSCFPSEVLALVSEHLADKDLYNLALTGKILGGGPNGIQSALKARWIKLAATLPPPLLETRFAPIAGAQFINTVARTVILGTSATGKNKGKPLYLRKGWLKTIMLAWKKYILDNPGSSFVSFLITIYRTHRKEKELLTNDSHKQAILLRYINQLPEE